MSTKAGWLGAALLLACSTVASAGEDVPRVEEARRLTAAEKHEEAAAL